MQNKSKEFELIITNINKALELKQLSKNELAKRANLPVSTVGRILSGERNFTVDKMIPLAKALEIELDQFFSGITINKQHSSQVLSKDQYISVGILSIGRKRLTCILDSDQKIIGTSELIGDLDLAEPINGLLELIKLSIVTALATSDYDQYKNLISDNAIPDELLRKIDIKLVTQSYEFLKKRKNFIYKANQIFHSVIHMPDWQITYLTDFDKTNKGISLVVDKGVSLSYKYNNQLIKVGGWKFPVYDFGGENWLGTQAIHHTISAVEGLEPKSNLSEEIFLKYDRKLENITEACFYTGPQNTDVYCLFCDILIRLYLMDDYAAKKIIDRGFNEIKKLINRADKDFDKLVKIAIHGSLAKIYEPYFQKQRLKKPSSDKKKVELLATITLEYLKIRGVNYIE